MPLECFRSIPNFNFRSYCTILPVMNLLLYLTLCMIYSYYDSVALLYHFYCTVWMILYCYPVQTHVHRPKWTKPFLHIFRYTDMFVSAIRNVRNLSWWIMVCLYLIVGVMVRSVLNYYTGWGDASLLIFSACICCLVFHHHIYHHSYPEPPDIKKISDVKTLKIELSKYVRKPGWSVATNKNTSHPISLDNNVVQRREDILNKDLLVMFFVLIFIIWVMFTWDFFTIILTFVTSSLCYLLYCCFSHYYNQIASLTEEFANTSSNFSNQATNESSNFVTTTTTILQKEFTNVTDNNRISKFVTCIAKKDNTTTVLTE